MTDIPFKAQAQRLADYLSRVHGVKLKHASMLEAIAQVHGRADWNTLLACGSTDFPPASSDAAASSPLPAVPTTPTPVRVLLTHLLEIALSEGSDTLDLCNAEDGMTAFVRVHSVRRQIFSGTRQEFMQLMQSLRALVGTAAPNDVSREFVQCGLRFDSTTAGPLAVKVHFMPGFMSTESHVFLRWKHPGRAPLELSDLGLSSIAEWRRALSQENGVLVVGGPTGTGKTSTVVASARELARQGRRVFVLDSDIREGDVPGAVHGQPRQDAGVVVVIDLRSEEHVRSAFDFAREGALVLATLHTNSLVRALARITDSGVSQDNQYQLLRGLVVQRLLPRACKACAGKGCSACYRGAVGRVLVAECVTPRDNATIPQRLFGEYCDVVPMVEDAVEYCRLGAITPESLAQQFGDDVRWRLAVRRSQDIA